MAQTPGDPLIEGLRNVEVASVADAIEQLYGQKAYMSHDMRPVAKTKRSEEHTSELQSLRHLVCRLLLEKKKRTIVVLAGVSSVAATAASQLAYRRSGAVLAPSGWRSAADERLVRFRSCLFFFLKSAAPAVSPPFTPPLAPAL